MDPNTVIVLTIQQGVESYTACLGESAEMSDVARAFLTLLPGLYGGDSAGAMMAVRDVAGVTLYHGYDYGFTAPEQSGVPRTEYGEWDKNAHGKEE